MVIHRGREYGISSLIAISSSRYTYENVVIWQGGFSSFGSACCYGYRDACF
jgi:hypothetical protein